MKKQVTFRLEEDMYKELRIFLIKNDLSFQGYIEELIKNDLGYYKDMEEEAKKEMLKGE